MRRSRVALATAALLASLAAWADANELPIARESELKASFIYNLTLFVDWPSAAFERPTAPLVIAIVGRDPFDGRLERLLADKTVQSHPIEVVGLGRSDATGQLSRLHVLFIPRSEAAHAAPLIAQTRRSKTPVLTISDAPEFAATSGIIGLVPDGARLRFEINRDAAEDVGLKLSSRLLTLAHIVTTDEPAVDRAINSR